MLLTDFDYDLPAELIAQFPPQERGASRMLHLHGDTGAVTDTQFDGITEYLNPGDVLVVNDTRVLNARLYGRKASGGRIEYLVERVIDSSEFLSQIRASHSPKPGSQVLIDPGFRAEVLAREGDLYRLRLVDELSVLDLLDRHGSIPLPPYIERTPEELDASRYQTVYAEHAGSVAAPTAGLHFTERMLERIRAQGVTVARVTLHVGAGTFQPVRATHVTDHKMHSEVYNVPQETADAIRACKARGGKVVAVGTTSLRTLEAAGSEGALMEGPGETNLFIFPGYRFRVVDVLFTNFHLPKSTLLMLVCAFGGMDNVLSAYRHAVAQRYRFFSYGDAMLVERRNEI